MRYAIISDIHANKFAFDALYKDIEKKNVNEIICLGDIVTKYQYPKEVLDEIRKTVKVAVKGNCDDNVVKHEAFKYTRDEIGIDGINYLESLNNIESLKLNDININFYHATKNSLDNMFNPLFDNKNTLYKDKIANLDDMFIGCDPQINFVGHTHQDYIGKMIGKNFRLIDYRVGSKIYLSKFDRAIINVGSVGDSIRMLKDKNNNYFDRINEYFTYAIVDDHLEYAIEVSIETVSYKKILQKLYDDLKYLKENTNIPVFDSHYKKVSDSACNMCDIIKKRKKR